MRVFFCLAKVNKIIRQIFNNMLSSKDVEKLRQAKPLANIGIKDLIEINFVY